MKKIFSLGLILATLLSLISAKPVSAQTIATVSVSPQSTSVTVGSPVTVDVRIAGGTNVAAYQFRLNYNPAVFQIASTANVVNGSFLGSAAGRTITFSTPTIDTTTNPATVLVSAYSTGTLNTGANGAGILASVTFNTLSSAVNSPLTLSSVQVVMGDLDANLQTSTNVNSSVTVNATITNTPIPSVTPTRTPTPVPPTPTRTPTPVPPTPTRIPTPTVPAPTITQSGPTVTPGAGSIIDNFEGYSGSNTNLQAAWIHVANGNTFTTTLDTVNKNSGSYGMRIDYTVDSATNDHGGANKNVNLNWSSSNGIQFWLKPDGSNRILHIQFEEAVSNEYWETTLPLSGSTAGGVITIPFSSFTYPSWYTGGNNIQDLGSIQQFSLYVNQDTGTAGSGTIYVDNIVSTSSASCSRKALGDADCNGTIDGVDYSKWLNSQCVPGTGQTCASYNADFNADSRVDDTDLAVWTANHI